MPSSTLHNILNRAIEDQIFQQQLLQNPDIVAQDFPLSSREKELLASLRQSAIQMASFRGEEPGAWLIWLVEGLLNQSPEDHEPSVSIDQEVVIETEESWDDQEYLETDKYWGDHDYDEGDVEARLINEPPPNGPDD